MLLFREMRFGILLTEYTVNDKNFSDSSKDASSFVFVWVCGDYYNWSSEIGWKLIFENCKLLIYIRINFENRLDTRPSDGDNLQLILCIMYGIRIYHILEIAYGLKEISQLPSSESYVHKCHRDWVSDCCSTHCRRSVNVHYHSAVIL